MPELLIRTQDGGSKRVPLQGDHLSLGRSPNNELCFSEDFGLSRQHLVFERKGDQWTVRDLGSKNGTLFNSERLTAARTLAMGDRVSAGHLTIDFRTDGMPAVPAHQTVFFVDGLTDTADAAIVTDLKNALGKAEAEAPRQRSAELDDRKAVQALIRAGQELSGLMPLNDLFELILQLAMDAVGASRGLLMILEGKDLALRAARGDTFQISTTVRDRVIEERASILVVDAMLDSALRDRRSIVEQKVRSVMAVPLQTHDRVIGLIYVDVTKILQPFTQGDLNLLTVLANVAAIRIEQARLAAVEQAERILEHELGQAAEIQRKLLPPGTPALPDMDVSACNLPCRTVGGDYYDFLSLPDGRTGFIVADVAGKGMPAALLMSSLQAALHAIAETSGTVEEIISRLNRNISARCPKNRFITLFAGVLDCRTGALSYVNAGHNPPLLVRADGRTDKLEASGLVLGLFGAAQYTEGATLLNVGDALILFSDGVTEACRPATDDEFGEDRIAQTVLSNAGQGSEVILERVMQSLKTWTAGAPYADDVTLMVVQRRPGGACAI